MSWPICVHAPDIFSYTRTCPVFSPLSSLPLEPTARILPLLDKVTLEPQCSEARSPTILWPICVHTPDIYSYMFYRTERLFVFTFPELTEPGVKNKNNYKEHHMKVLLKLLFP